MAALSRRTMGIDSPLPPRGSGAHALFRVEAGRWHQLLMTP
jgi:hypothetical protein